MEKRKPRNNGRPIGMSKKTIEKCELVEFHYAKGELSLNKSIAKAKVSKASYYKWREREEEKEMQNKIKTKK